MCRHSCARTARRPGGSNSNEGSIISDAHLEAGLVEVLALRRELLHGEHHLSAHLALDRRHHSERGLLGRMGPHSERLAFFHQVRGGQFASNSRD